MTTNRVICSIKSYTEVDSLEQGIADHIRAGFLFDKTESNDEKTVLKRTSKQDEVHLTEIVTLALKT